MKAFASDFDNTLHFTRNGEGYFKESDMNAISSFRKTGSLFGLCTGRPMYGFEGDMDEGPVLDFLIASTGAIVSRTNHNTFEVLHERTITVEQVEAIHKMCDGRGVLYIHADGHVYTLFYKRPQNYDHQIILQDVHQLDGKHITAISIWTIDTSISAELTADINDIFHGTLDAYQNVNWLDVVQHGVSKGYGLLKAKEKLDIDVIAGIGDSFNDIPLLESADVSFTFHTSDLAVKEKADHVVDSLWEAIEIFEKEYQ